MAFCIKYDNKTLKDGISPYNDIKKRRLIRTNDVVFFSRDNMCSGVDYMFIPRLGTIMVDHDYLDYMWDVDPLMNMYQFYHFTIDDLNNIVKVDSYTVLALENEKLLLTYREVANNVKYIESIIRFSINKVVTYLFGADWTCELPMDIPHVEGLGHILECYYVNVNYSFTNFYNAIQMFDVHEDRNRIIGYVDPTSAENEAVTKISAAFRGWKARMKYRFNPYTSLGYLALKEFKDMVGN